jgi:hypothetical protein
MKLSICKRNTLKRNGLFNHCEILSFRIIIDILKKESKETIGLL